ncbi:MAG: hypothetical protein EP335_03875 [Alphaproteobacteria bacterium]|nr:MAG: hypothetical protein EP335_03875 [Alphaproteobacteria bacterium]
MTQRLYETLAKRIVFWLSLILAIGAGSTLALLFLFRSEFLAEADSDLERAIEQRRNFAEFRTAFGYGGFIHHFKNYVLRGQPEYLEQANRHFREAQFEWTGVKQDVPGFFNEKADIDAMLTNYADALQTANQTPRESAETLDDLVRVNDAPAFMAIATIDTYIANQILALTEARHTAEVQIGLWLLILLFLTILSVFVNYLNRSIRTERQEVAAQELAQSQKLRDLAVRHDLLELQQHQAEELGGFGTWLLNLDTEEMQWSNGIFALHGRPITAGVPPIHEAARYYDPDTRNQMAQLVQVAVTNKSGFSFRFPLTREDGQRRLVASSGQYAAHQGHYYLVGLYRDVTAEKDPRAA